MLSQFAQTRICKTSLLKKSVVETPIEAIDCYFPLNIVRAYSEMNMNKDFRFNPLHFEVTKYFILFYKIIK